MITLTIPCGITLTSFLLVGLSGDGVGTINPAGFSMYLAPAVLMNFTTGPWGEEAGWRGYLTPKLLQTQNAIVASLLVGFLWGIWHLP